MKDGMNMREFLLSMLVVAGVLAVMAGESGSVAAREGRVAAAIAPRSAGGAVTPAPVRPGTPAGVAAAPSPPPVLERDLPPVTTVPLASEAQFDLELVNMYAEFDPANYEASIIADAWLIAAASTPVVLQCAGNFKSMQITGDQANLAFRHVPPYFWFYNIQAGQRRITFTYRVRHDGYAGSGAIIATNRLALDRSSFWYPRNIASDAHQIQLNLVTDPAYAVYSNASVTRDVPNNLKRLRTLVIAKPTETGLELRGTP